MTHFDDHHIIDQKLQYIDGAMGGVTNTAVNISPEMRVIGGLKFGMEHAEEIIATLRRSGGVITESLKFVTHSMGGAFGKGVVRGIIEWAKANPEKSNGLRISVYDFDPFQGGRLIAEERVHTEQSNHSSLSEILGFLANQKQNGLDDKYGQEKGDNNKYRENTMPGTHQGSHTILTFFNDISSLQEGTYKLKDGKWVKQ